MGDYSEPQSKGLIPGMLSGKEKGVLCIVFLTSEGVCVSVPTAVSDVIGAKETEKLMDDVAEAACRHTTRKQ